MEKVDAKKKKYIIIIIIIVCLLLCIGIVYLFVNKSKNKVKDNDRSTTSTTISTTIPLEGTTRKALKNTIKIEDSIFSDVADNFKNINNINYNKKFDSLVTYEKDNNLVYTNLIIENEKLYEVYEKEIKINSGYLSDKKLKKLIVIPDEGSFLVYVLTTDGYLYLNDYYKVDSFKKVSSSLKIDDFTFIDYGGNYTGDCYYSNILLIKSDNQDYILTSAGPELYSKYKKELSLLTYPFCFADTKFKVNYSMKLIDIITNKPVLDNDNEEISVDYMVRDTSYIYVVNSKYLYIYDYVTEKFDKKEIKKISKESNGLSILLKDGDQYDLVQSN